MFNEVTVQNIAARHAITPKDTNDLCEFVKSTGNSNLSIISYGDVYEWYGNPPQGDFVVINTPQGILEHYVKDMTIKVCGGTRLDDLQAALAEQNQWLPIDGVDGQTQIGEMVAHQAHGRLRSGYGTFRDLLLGLSYVNASGKLIQVGGRTVKNVAGYDVTRFMVGNANTLGLIHDVTLRTWSRPAGWMKITLNNIKADMFDQLGTPLITGDSAPITLTYELNRNDSQQPHYTLSYEGEEKSCNIQLQALTNLLNQSGVSDISLHHQMLTHPDFYNQLLLRGNHIWNCECLMKIVVPSNQTGRILNELINAPATIEQLETQPLFGTILIGGNWEQDQAMRMTTFIRDMLNQQGFLVWLKRAQDDTPCEIVIPRPTDWEMIDKIAKQLDPHNLFNPGRLY